jgi:hypothetical protein
LPAVKDDAIQAARPEPERLTYRQSIDAGGIPNAQSSTPTKSSRDYSA